MDEENQIQIQNQEKNNNIQQDHQNFKATVDIPCKKSVGDSAENLQNQK